MKHIVKDIVPVGGDKLILNRIACENHLDLMANKAISSALMWPQASLFSNETEPI